MLLKLIVISCVLVHVSADLADKFLPEGYSDFWFLRLILNLLGYSTIIVPGYIAINYFKKIRYDEQKHEGSFANVVTMCVFGNQPDKAEVAEEGGSASAPPPKPEKTFAQNAALLSFCFVGLQVSYLTWGLLQERIMAHTYIRPVTAADSESTEGVQFKNSQFLVFINRVLALLIGCIVLKAVRQARHTAPLYKYSYCSFSNIMSSWFQYEALKFVSFPTQVLCKASKVIPVMLMGKVVSKKTYQTYEYVTAAMLSAGVALFLFSDHESNSETEHKGASETTFSGVLLMMGYMAFDSFTSNWQGELFTQYKMTSVQMMTGVNLFSCLFTLLSLIEQASFLENITFMIVYPQFMLHACVLSICSATGQLFIYYTISQFGPVTFIIIMTIRMALAILLSCYWFGHAVGVFGILGIIVVFLSLFGKIYLGQRLKAAKARQAAKQPSPGKEGEIETK